MKAKIEKVAYIGLRGIDYEEIELGSEVLTALTGPAGAGKTTLAICLGYALLPDKKVLDIRPISEVQDSHVVGLDFLAGLINDAYEHAYIVLDISTRLDTRLIAGIHISVSNGFGLLKRWIIKDVPKEISLHEILRVEDGDSEYYPDLSELSRNLANRSVNPMDLKQLKTVGEYGAELYDAGILPTDLVHGNDRSLYAKLIETTFNGGISREVSAKLKEYLLPQEKRLPDIVSKLQECTDQVLRTRRAAKDAGIQLDIIKSVYGNGKDLVTFALRRITAKLSESEKHSDALAVDIADKEKQIETLSGKPGQIEEEIKMADANLTSLLDAENARLRLLIADADRLNDEFAAADKKETEYFDRLNSFREAEKLWLKLAGNNSSQTIQWLTDWFDTEEERAKGKKYEIEQSIKQLQIEKASLDRSTTDIKTQLLAEMVGGRTLDESFNNLTEDEAIALELSMGGLTAGVVNCTPEDLADVAANDTLPEIFWIGKEKPSASPIIRSGEWYLSARQDGGYTVFSQKRKPVLGAQARNRRKGEIAQKIAELTSVIGGINKSIESLKNSHESLLRNETMINLFLNNRNSLDRFTQDWVSAKNKKEKIERERKNVRAERNKLQSQISELSKPYLSNIAALKEQKIEAETRLKNLRKSISELQPQIEDAKKVVKEYRQKLLEAKDILQSNFDFLLTDAESLRVITDTQYTEEQTKRIIAISRGLEDEPPARLVSLQEATPGDEVSCVRLWPVLKDILRDRVPADILDNLGEDIIKGMQEKRENLDFQLKRQEDEVKIEAHNIYLTLRSEINSKQRQIKRLSKLGENVQFGNVMGVRINVQINDDLLSLVQSCTDQLLMFSENPRPIEEALSEFFRKEMDQKIEGEDLLDYRTYMSLDLEVKRKNRDWERASSLSGGESIGCGLAIGLMLVRSLAARGDIKPDQINPIFVVDEVHRLDAFGQKTIIDFGQREGFQVLVTAVELKPEYPCKLYFLNRDFKDDKETLVLRAGHMKPKKEVA